MAPANWTDKCAVIVSLATQLFSEHTQEMAMTTATTHDTTNLLDEDLVSPADGVEELTGERPAPTTCWRWISKGLRGHKLESVKVMGRTYTSHQAIRRWLAAVESTRTEAQAAARDDGTGDRPEHIQRKLEAAGLI
jgi:hypothetical protein